MKNKRKELQDDIVNYSADLMDKHFPKGECKERGKALVFNAELISYMIGKLDQELENAKREGNEELSEAIIKYLEHQLAIVGMFNPVSEVIGAKQEGELEAYRGLLSKLK